jgi:protein TonB
MKSLAHPFSPSLTPAFVPPDKQTKKFSVQYGRLEMQRIAHKYGAFGLTASIVVHLLIIGGYLLNNYLQEDEDIPTVHVRLLKYSQLGPPPSIMDAPTAPSLGVAAEAAKPTVGIPVPVPDAEVSPEQTIATQTEMSAIQAPGSGEGVGTGTSVVQQDVKIEDEDENPPDFVAVEKLPVLIKAVKPEYPELARRAMVEGTVYVKVLVDKEGKPKKPSVVKSDADIFNDPALAAALQCMFTPAVMNNGPVAVWTTIPFHFKLNK